MKNQLLHKFKAGISLLSLLVLSNTGLAYSYHVDSSGDDTNNGLSINTAWQTIQHASDMVQPGDSVIVYPGQYVGFYHTTSGTAAARIIFSAIQGTFINQPNAITDDGINLEGASYITIEGFNIQSMPRAGIRSVVNTDAVIRNNICTANGYWGIFTGFSENVLIQSNLCASSQNEHGIYVSNSADHPRIIDNYCRFNHGSGIHMNGDLSQGGDGIISFAEIVGNSIHNNGEGGGSGINCDGVQDSYITNNLLYGNQASGISLYQIDAGEPCHRTAVVNNTIIQPDNGRWALNITNGSADVIVFNNILLSRHSFRGAITTDATAVLSLRCNHNICADRFSIDDGDAVLSLAQWQVQTNQDNQSILAEEDDLFYSALANDFWLIEGSLAIDAGVSSYQNIDAPNNQNQGVSAVYSNIARPQGLGWDIGAFELEVAAHIESYLSTQGNWFNLLPSTSVLVYDLIGRLLFEGTKHECKLEGYFLFKELHSIHPISGKVWLAPKRL